MKLLLLDTTQRANLYPLTLTRATCSLRIGTITLQQRWERLLSLSSDVITEDYLQVLHAPITPGEYIIVNSEVRPLTKLTEQILQLDSGTGLFDDNGWLAARLMLDETFTYGADIAGLCEKKITIDQVELLRSLMQLLNWNDAMIREDVEWAKQNLRPATRPVNAQLTSAENIFIEDGALVEHCHLNASAGPIFIAKNSMIMDGALIRGPFALCEGATVKMGAKIYGSTTIGAGCTAGGEIKNSIMMGYSNKAHDGYLGDSIIGEWCNLGAGTTNSNVKNNADQVKLYSYAEKQLLPAGKKCGLIMGDYSRAAINTSFNTGTVVGVSCNVFGDGLTPKFTPDFSWGYSPMQPYQFDKAIDHIGNWMKFKNNQTSEQAIKVLKHIFEQNRNTQA